MHLGEVPVSQGNLRERFRNEVNPRVGARCNTRAQHWRSNPSRWWKTTRAEHEGALAGSFRRRTRKGEPGVDSGVVSTTEGRSLDNPRRGSPVGQPAGPTDRQVSGKPASKVRRVASTYALRVSRQPERGSSRTSIRAQARE